jgi:hypothetical protein
MVDKSNRNDRQKIEMVDKSNRNDRQKIEIAASKIPCAAVGAAETV